ncbi:MAG: MATE family efflux transporter [Eubacteriales bacterium]|nr:MATE family efflux transporter [Eubacteriales bacterium]
MQNELFEKAPVPKAYFKLALPVVFSMVVSLIYNMVDTYFIAQTGNTNLVAGVSLSAPIFTLMIALGDIFGLGGSSVISRLFGQKQDADGKCLSVFCFYAAILCGVIVAAVLMLFRNPVLRLLGADEETFTYASQYFTYIVIGAPFIIVSYTPSNLLRTEGFATASMTGTVLGAVVNMILDPIFISGLQWGAAGAAIATVIGNICTDIFFVWFLLKKSKRLSINPRELRIKTAELGQIFAIGIPASITNLMQSLGTALTNRFLLPYGNEKVAAMGIVMKINMIAVLILVGFAFGAQPLIGYNYGAKNDLRLKKILRFCYGFECGIALVLAVILSAAAPGLVGMFMQDSEMIATGVPMLRMQQVGMVFVAIVLVTTCTFQSAGKAGGAFLLSVSRQGVIFAAVLLIASKVLGYTGVLLAQAVSDFLTAILAVGLFYTLVWKEMQPGKMHKSTAP